MKNLDLKKIGVQELDAKEMVEVEGGLVGLVATFVIGAWLADSLFNYNSTVENFKKGYDSVE